MKQKFVFLALFLANVQILLGFHYPQYEDHPEITPTKSINQYKSHPPFGLLNKKRTDHQFGEFLKRKFNTLDGDSGLRKFNSLGGDNGLRKFQKAPTHSLRRNNIDESKVVKETEPRNECPMPSKNAKEELMRRFIKHPLNDNDDDLKTLDKKIDDLIKVHTFRKFQKIFNSVLSDDYTDSRIDGVTNTENVKRRVNDDMGEASDYDSSDESSEEKKNHEGSGTDVI